MKETWNILISISLFTSIFAVLTYKRMKTKAEERLIRRLRKKQNAINIGAIFGMDIGGTLTKVIYFETKLERQNNGTVPVDPLLTNTIPSSAPTQPMKKRSSTESLAQLESPDHQAALEQLYTYMDNNQTMKNSSIVIRDDVLSVFSKLLGGRFHFLHFETRNMVQTIKFLSSNALAENVSSIGCTGGGSHKYAHEFQEELGITFNKFDELHCLVRGMHFALTNFKDECYTFRNISTTPTTPVNGSNSPKPAAPSRSRWQKDLKEERVDLPYESLSTFPYLVVNIGSGVSILKVSAPGVFERVSGSSLGGGTYWGLCRLMTKCATFDEVLDIAETGDAGVVDMLVKDIYGGDYGGSHLSGSMVASSFGRLVMKENPREGVKEEDLALALLMMITNNIGQVAYLNAQLHHCSKIFFVGSFLRHNPISARRLAFAIDFWSGSKMEALFLVHEGYFGAMGTFLQSAFGDDVDKILSSREYSGEQVPRGGLTSPSKTPFSGSVSSNNSNDSSATSGKSPSSTLNKLDATQADASQSSSGSTQSPFGKYISQFSKWRNKSFNDTVPDTDTNSPASPVEYPRKNRSSSDDYVVRSAGSSNGNSKLSTSPRSGKF